jgi:hypothetical protein
MVEWYQDRKVKLYLERKNGNLNYHALRGMGEWYQGKKVKLYLERKKWKP